MDEGIFPGGADAAGPLFVVALHQLVEGLDALGSDVFRNHDALRRGLDSEFAGFVELPLHPFEAVEDGLLLIHEHVGEVLHPAFQRHQPHQRAFGGIAEDDAVVPRRLVAVLRQAVIGCVGGILQQLTVKFQVLGVLDQVL